MDMGRLLGRVAGRRFLRRGPQAAAGAGGAATGAPDAADWHWRPEAWHLPIRPPGLTGIDSGARFGAELSLFHDCAAREMTVRQVAGRGGKGTGPFGLLLEVFRFDGSFLSLVLDLPPAAVDGLTRRHLVGLAARIEAERPLEIFARLNVRHGPNTEQLVREIPAGTRQVAVEFDLAYADLNEKRVERAWLDLIFEGPEMNQVAIRDLALYRRPRAEI